MNIKKEKNDFAGAHKKANNEKYEAHSKSTLKRHIETKFRTTMIGALSRFEKVFGDLWGHGLKEGELTEEQKIYREKWQLARTEILNNGNNQMRAALSEVDNNTIKYNKNQYNFFIKKDNQELTENE